MSTKKSIIILSIFVALISTFAIGFAYYWNKLDLIQYEKPDVTYENPTDDETVTTAMVEEETTTQNQGNEIENEKNINKETVTTSKESDDFLEEVTKPVEPVIKEDNIKNVLLIATDEKTRAFTNNANSDCMIIMSINSSKGTVKLVSLERGTAVPIKVGQYAGDYEWLNYMVRLGGPGLLLKTVEEVFRVDLEGYVRVNPTIFIEIVDACGGVDITLSKEEADYVNERQSTQVVTEGKNHLNGIAAEKYSRCRAIDDDWGRIVRQRKVIQAAIKQADSFSLSEINDMLNQVLPLVQTDLTKKQITELILTIPSIAGKTASQMSLPKSGTYTIMKNKYGKNMFATDFETNAIILQDFLYD